MLYGQVMTDGRRREPLAPWTHLRRLRLRKRKTLEEAAAEIGKFGRAHLNHLELGRVGPSDPVLFALAEYYGVEPDELDKTRPPLPDRVGEFAHAVARRSERASTKAAA